MRSIAIACATALLACAELSPSELRLEGEETLRACGEQRVDTSLCLSLEVIQAEYELCLRQDPAEGCDEVWRAMASLGAPAPLRPPPLSFRRGFYP